MLESTVKNSRAKIPNRVIEVFEYFDDTNRAATVMDITRRYNQPQSSSSEPLAALTDIEQQAMRKP